MADLYNVLRPHIIVFLAFGINLDGQKTRLRKWAVKAWLIVRHGLVLPFELFACVYALFTISLLSTPSRTTQSAAARQLILTSMCNCYLISVGIRLYMLIATKRVNYIAIWKRLTLRHDEYCRLRLKDYIRMACITAINILPIFQTFEMANGQCKIMDKDIIAKALIMFTMLGPLIDFFFPSYCCCLYAAITDNLNSQLKYLSTELKKPKSPYRLNRVIKRVIEEFEQLEQLALSTNQLFAPMISAASLNSLIALPSLIATNTSNIWVFGWKGKGTMICFTIHICLVFYCVFQAVKCNSKMRNFLRLMAERVHDGDNGTQRALDLIQPRVDQLCWIINRRITNFDWFTLCWGFEMDIDLFITTIQIARDVLRFTMKA